jgi:hypothetical protein
VRAAAESIVLEENRKILKERIRKAQGGEG